MFDWLDIDGAIWLAWIFVFIFGICAIVVIKTMEKSGWRTFIAVILIAAALTLFGYERTLERCEKSGDSCKFFSYEIAPDGGVIE